MGPEDQQELRTLDDYDRELETLQAERDRLAQLLEDPEQRDARRMRRQQLMGRWAESLRITPTHLKAIRKVSGSEAWLFDADVMRADGWVDVEPEVWKYGAG